MSESYIGTVYRFLFYCNKGGGHLMDLLSILKVFQFITETS